MTHTGLICVCVWCGVVWCGVLCCGVVWCAVVCCGVWVCETPQSGSVINMCFKQPYCGHLMNEGEDKMVEMFFLAQ